MFTKKKILTTRKNTTRKLPSFEKLPKTNGSRIFSMETYKINCGKNKLYGFKTIKAAEETSMHKDDFVHVVLSKLQDYDKPVVVKIYDANKIHLLLEKKILKKINGYRNTARLICEFSCNDDKHNYVTKITKQIKFCERGTNNLYFFIYEYIAHGDISDYLQNTRDINSIKTLILQVVCVIIELAIIYKVCHGDLNSGNILINTTNEKTLEYRIGDEIVVIESNGVIPIIIDFGRSKFYDEPINTPLDIYSGTPKGVPLDMKGQLLPINQLKGKQPTVVCPISNVHRFKMDIWYDIIMMISIINRYIKNYNINLVTIECNDPFELDLPSIKDYYFYVRDALYMHV